MIKLSPITRLSLGLTVLTVTLLLVIDFLGFMPNERRVVLDNRKVVAELLAIQVSAQIGQDNPEQVSELLQTLRERSDDVLSIGVRLANNQLLVAAGDHLKHWIPQTEDRSTLELVVVPIFESAGRWGSLEIAFKSPYATLATVFSKGSLNLVVVLVFLFAFIVFWLFLKRALRELDPRSVVPERVNQALNVLSEGLVMLDQSGRIVLVNSAFQAKTGHTETGLMGTRLSDLTWYMPGRNVGEQFRHEELPWVELLEHQVLNESVLLELRATWNEILTFSANVAPVTAGDGSMRGVLVTFDDITEIEKQNNRLVQAVTQLKISQMEIERKNNELEVLATRDPLTGTLNRRSLFEAMGVLVNDARDLRSPLSCMMVDIDHFKSINDRFGHAVGDHIIKLLVNILTDTASPSALVGRYGGEEFVIVLPDTDEADAAELAEEMRTLVSNAESTVGETTIRISSSFGVACDQDGLLSSGELVDRADKALYKAKETGRNRVEMFSRLEHQVKPDDDTGSTVSDLIVETPPGAEGATLYFPPFNPDASQSSQNPRVGGSSVVLLDRLTQGIERSKRFGTHLSVMYIHIDALEVISNTQGNASAEKMVADISSRLKTVLRSSDTVVTSTGSAQNISVSRVGVAELFVLLTDIRNSSDTTWIVKRISQELQIPLDYNSSEISADMRSGISLYPSDSTNPQGLIANARSALRDAKQSANRNCTLYYDEEMNTRSDKQLNMEAELQQALARDELYLVYQPLVNLTNGKLIGFETLVRWQSARFGLVSPAQFIPIAERSQLIVPLGRWIFEQAVRQLKDWREKGHTEITISVNFSAIQLRAKEFVEDVSAVLERHDVPASAVTIEITESIIIEDVTAAIEIIERLQSIGLRIALDDFGTGYSSLSYLKNMPINLVKIDRSFFSDFPHNKRDTSIVSAIISLAHSLGLNVVAEGVETEDQLAAIKQMQCDIVQGYVFAQPQSREQTSLLLQDAVQQRRFLRQLENAESLGERAGLSSVDGVISNFDQTNRFSPGR
ncbi:MAG: EAL domain-containing protein [Gammaproteobacteria bacterium]|nr:EAL domain-containing protein [Gammaproteobacteria bacterium]